MALLLAAAQVLLLLGLPEDSQCLCSPTAFYKNCWIRRFPGLLVDLRESRRRGAQLLKGYAEISPQQCSRTCCLLRNVSCNLAVFYHGAIHENRNCLHMSCPALESCILKAGADVILYNITTGIDPDLLIFEKLKSQEPNAFSSASKSEKQHSTKTPEGGRCQHHNGTTSGSPLLRAPPAATSRGLPASTPTPSWSLKVQRTEGTAYSRADTSPAAIAFATRTSSRSVTSSDKIAHSALSPKPAQVLSHMPTPPHLNSSKQHLNETKGYSGRNSTSDNEAAAWEAAALGVWLIPVVLCSSLLCLCCCTVALTAGRCGYRRGHYKPVRTRTTMSRQLIKYAPVRGNL
ncbi:MANSC domain-containing protein 4 isoform X1 [Motacilla alba alba]|uniref:MANSC domain-containing protein 4 isoform X1 n=1 Tax=Motacilla alba alba TaxID=1094192 RepID=UPI0018D4FE29|nr:MANSC domain-containing protein 4 isoform X1 [Motacilla alba alba]